MINWQNLNTKIKTVLAADGTVGSYRTEMFTLRDDVTFPWIRITHLVSAPLASTREGSPNYRQWIFRTEYQFDVFDDMTSASRVSAAIGAIDDIMVKAPVNLGAGTGFAVTDAFPGSSRIGQDSDLGFAEGRTSWIFTVEAS